MENTFAVRRTYSSPGLSVRGREFLWGSRTYIAGIINVTPDSFSGDGLGRDTGAAAALALAMEERGADLLDIGAESSRPGSAPITEQEELDRLIPALRAVRAATTLPISVDTWRAGVASAAGDEGADLINDIHGLLGESAMASLIAKRGLRAIAMHNQRGRHGTDVVAEIRSGFDRTLRAALSAGVQREAIILDPGFGFGWTPEQNLEMLRRLPELWDFGLPLLVGVSRKSTLGAVLGAPAEERLEATIGAVAVCVAAGADLVRVHDVLEISRAVRIADAIVRGNWRGSS